MTRIDRYLLFLYGRILFICFASIASLFVVIHLFGSLGDFDRIAQQDNESMLSAAFEYYRPFTLSLFERLSSLLALLALLFTIGWLNRTNELTALLAAGVTKSRVVRPLLMASAGVILTAVILRETIIPRFQDHLDRKPGDLTGEYPRPIRPAFDPQTMCLIQGKHLIPVTKEIAEINIRIQGEPLLSAIGPKLLAKRAHFQEASDERPTGYLLRNVQIPRNIDLKPSVYDSQSQQLLLMTSKDAAWIDPGDCFLVSSIEYEILRGGSSWQQYASAGELITHLKAEKMMTSGNELQVSIHQRLLRPLVDWTVLLLGIPILLKRPDRHLFWVAGMCLGIVGGFTGLVMGLAALGTSGLFLSPHLAIWLPLLLFLPWAWASTQDAMNC
jgi:lipopolysaccharide export system permease protein